MAGYIGGKVAISSPQQIETKHTVTATASQTSITNVGYTVGAVHVYQNGVRLVDGTDYTATNGSTVTLSTGATENDQIVIVSHGSFETADTVSKASGGTFSGNVAVSGSVTATSLVVPDGSIPLVDLDIDGGTDIGAALVDADLMVVDDGAGGTNRKATMSRLATYMGTKIGGGMEFIASSGEISDAASASFTGFDASKYDNYVFYLNYVKPATDSQKLYAYASTNGGSSYDETNGNYHYNGETDTVGFNINQQSTAGNDTNEYGIAGQLKIIKPSASAYTIAQIYAGVFHTNGAVYGAATGDYINSYYRSTTAVNAIQFKFGSGNIASGEIVMFGIVNS